MSHAPTPRAGRAKRSHEHYRHFRIRPLSPLDGCDCRDYNGYRCEPHRFIRIGAAAARSDPPATLRQFIARRKQKRNTRL